MNGAEAFCLLSFAVRRELLVAKELLMMYGIISRRWVTFNRMMLRALGALGLLMSALLIVFAVRLYMGGSNFRVSLSVAAFNLIAGISLLRSSR